MTALELIRALIASYFLSMAAVAHLVCVLWWLHGRQRLLTELPRVLPGSRLDEERCMAIVGDMELASSACAMTGVAATLFGVLIAESESWDVRAPYAGTIVGVFLAVLLGAKERGWRQRIHERVGSTHLDDLIANLNASTNIFTDTLSAMQKASDEILQTRKAFDLASQHLSQTAEALSRTLPVAIESLKSAVEDLPSQLQQQRMEAAQAEQQAAQALQSAAGSLTSAGTRLDRAAEDIKGASAGIDRVAERMGHVFDSLPMQVDERLRQTLASTGKLADVLDSVAGGVLKAAHTSERNMDRLNDQFAGINASLERSARSLHEATERFTRVEEQSVPLRQAVSFPRDSGPAWPSGPMKHSAVPRSPLLAPSLDAAPSKSPVQARPRPARSSAADRLVTEQARLEDDNETLSRRMWRWVTGK